MNPKPPLKIRTPLLLLPEDLAAVDDWRFANRVASRGEAIRRLIRAGLGSSAAEAVSTPQPDPEKALAPEPEKPPNFAEHYWKMLSPEGKVRKAAEYAQKQKALNDKQG